VKKKRVAILGANGYLGKNMSFFLHSKGYLVENFDIQNSTNYKWMKYQQLDVLKKETLKKISSSNDFIFLFFGRTGTLNGFEDYKSFIETNEIGLLNILNHMKEYKFNGRVIFPSTRLVYKGKNGLPLGEDMEKETKTIYALNKFVGEELLKLYSTMFGIKYTIYRICVPYGNVVDSDYSYGTIGLFLKQALEKKIIILYGNGSSRRTFTSIEELCKSISFSMEKTDSVNEIFNIGGENLSLLDVATTLSSKLKDVKIKFVPWQENYLKIESGDTIFDSKKIEGLLNYKKKDTFKEWVEQNVKNYII